MKYKVAYDILSCFHILADHQVCSTCIFHHTHVDQNTWFPIDICDLNCEEVKNINLDGTCKHYKFNEQLQKRLRGDCT